MHACAHTYKVSAWVQWTMKIPSPIPNLGPATLVTQRTFHLAEKLQGFFLHYMDK